MQINAARCFKGFALDFAIKVQAAQSVCTATNRTKTEINMIIDAATLTIDLSRTPITSSLIEEFSAEHDEKAIATHKHALFSGERINESENRAAHHTALRDPVSDHPHALEARGTLEQTLLIAEQIRSGEWRGASGQRIETVVNIGIGGSDLGPRMLEAALASPDALPRVLFVANIDPEELQATLAHCDPHTTLFIIASKSFTTLETLENGLAARRWLLDSIAEAKLDKHLIAVTANREKAIEYGVAEESLLPLWDWVGGRYSLWSAIGLPIAIAIGSEDYRALLNGAHAMDCHFRDEPVANNAPTLMAMLEAHYQRALGAQSLAVLPYSYQLRLLPDYLQQLCMESNGKSVTRSGETVKEPTCSILWGSAGTVGQHSFHQLLHQGTQKFSVDFIFALRSSNRIDADDQRHSHLIANCLAQSEAFSNGKTFDQALAEVTAQGVEEPQASLLAKQKVIDGGKPNTLIAMQTVNPFSLGALIALYEHKTFVMSKLWDINAFDQWGVELGKQLSGPIYQAISGEAAPAAANQDKTTLEWVRRIQETS